MQWWYYRGAVTTPVDIPGRGPTVIRPRDKFQAPFAAVAHLKRLGRVVSCKAPKEEARQAPAQKSESESQKMCEERAVEIASVVASQEEFKVEKVKDVEEVVEEKQKVLELEKETPKEHEEKVRRSKRDKR